MIKQFFKIGGVKNEKDFLAKYPTEESFFRQHPEAMALLDQASPYVPTYGDMVMPQAMYGMTMSHGGYLPHAQNGMQVGGPGDPPRQEDYPDYNTFNQAMEEYLSGLQQQADMSQEVPQGSMPSQQTSNAVSFVDPAAMQTMLQGATAKKQLNDYQGVSIVDFLTAQGKPADFSSRKQLASALGISNYRGTASQNKQMIAMIQQSPEILESYEGVDQPTGGVRKNAASFKNAKGAPSTEEIAAAKQKALGNPDYQTLPGVTVNTGNVLQRAIQNSQRSTPVRKSIISGQYEATPAGGGPTMENLRRMQLAEQMNRQAGMQSSGFPMFRQGYARGGAYTGTWNANQGFDVGGAYIPDYASSAYGLPQFEMGAPIYADGGMSPEEAMMMQQQQGSAPMDQQQQIVQAVMQMLQQGMDPNQIMQQLVQGGVPPQMAQQVLMMVMEQIQGGQGGMGGGEPNGAQQPMAPVSPEQGMEGMQMPEGMARGGMTPGWEGEVTMEQLEDLRRKGIKFDII